MAELKEFKCPCCGAPIAFNAAAQKMKCEYCSTEFEAELLQSFDEELKRDGEDEFNWESRPESQWQNGEEEGIRIYSCSSCGGEIVGDSVTAATTCPYCSGPVVIKGQISGSLRPDLVIPFKLEKKDAKAALEKHLKGKPFLPKVFKDENHIDEIKGIYVPFWLFDTEVDARIRYKATKIRTWMDSKYHYTETRYFSAVRSGSAGFTSVPVDGSSKMADDLMESIEPFDVSEAVDFNTAYLSGFFADKYDVDSETSIGRANERIKTSTENVFASTLNEYSSFVKEHSDLRLSGGKERYALYPVWLLNTSWRGKKYMFAMNGQTGRFVGDLPIHKGKLFAWFGGILAASTVIAAFLEWLILNM